MTIRTSHTPGPWTASLADAGGFSHINAPTWGALAKVPVMLEQEPPKPLARLVKSEEGEANARVIAAAPELLEALQHFFTWHAENFEDFDDETNKQLLCLANEAETAIAKAEGRQ
jgi:hypothetical protein